MARLATAKRAPCGNDSSTAATGASPRVSTSNTESAVFTTKPKFLPTLRFHCGKLSEVMVSTSPPWDRTSTLAIRLSFLYSKAFRVAGRDFRTSSSQVRRRLPRVDLSGAGSSANMLCSLELSRRGACVFAFS